MRSLITFCLLLFAGSIGYGIDNPQVPSEMTLGSLKLKITEGARKDIQKDVDALRASPKYFQIKVDRMNLYFPIIERIFKEEKVPDEFKFLAIQESALISDAVSSANAVGFWQFKEPAGREVGLRIDRNIDERLNIVAASRGAAKYLKRMNFYFNNWAYACLAYNQGPGGAKKHVKEKEFGVKRMTVDRNMFWYVKKFIAHYVAFRDEVGQPHSQGLSLIEYEDGANKSLRQVAKELKADEQLVYQYNKWLKRGDIPGEKIYPVVVPFKGKKAMVIARSTKPTQKKEPKVEIYPDIKPTTSANLIVKLNDIKAIVASSGDNIEELARKGGIQVHHFIKFNDLQPTDEIIEGEIYYLRNKKSKSKVYYHTVKPDETLWEISQSYGIKLKKLRSKNRMEIDEELKSGRVLWLGRKRPKNVPIEYAKDSQESSQPPEVEEKDEKPVVNSEPPTLTIEEIPDEIEIPAEEKEEIPEPKIVVEDKATISYHLVRKGETLYRIAQMYSVSVKDIKQWNSLETNDLKPGMNLQLLTDSEPIIVNPAAEPEKEILFHEVAKGETLYSIAKKYGTSVSDLKALNLIEDGDALSIGQKLQVKGADDPEYQERKSKVQYHPVTSGETMYSIARKYNLSLKELMEMNDKTDSNISVGERLKISE